jgi:ribosomal protein L11
MSYEEFLNIFNEKKQDFPNFKDESIKSMILGTARNMGIVLHT